MLKEQDYQPKILYAAKLSIKNGDVWILNYFVHGNSKGLKKQKQRQTNKNNLLKLMSSARSWDTR